MRAAVDLMSGGGKQQSSASLPRVPVARLVGHDGPVQAVRFVTGKYYLSCQFVSANAARFCTFSWFCTLFCFPAFCFCYGWHWSLVGCARLGLSPSGVPR